MPKKSAAIKKSSLTDISRSAKSPPAQKERETDIVRSILNYLRVRGALPWRMPVQGVMHSSGGKQVFRKSPIAGFPDIAAMYKGVFCCFEVKTSTGRLSPHQKVWIDDLCRHGAIAACVRSVDEVAAILDRLELEL